MTPPVDIDVTVDGTLHAGWYQTKDGLITVTRPFCGGSETTRLDGHAHAPELAPLLLRALIEDERRLDPESRVRRGYWSWRV